MSIYSPTIVTTVFGSLLQVYGGEGDRTLGLGIKRPQAPTAGVRTETEPEGIVALSGLLTAPGMVLSAGHSPQKSPHLAHRWDALQRAEGAA